MSKWPDAIFTFCLYPISSILSARRFVCHQQSLAASLCSKVMQDAKRNNITGKMRLLLTGRSERLLVMLLGLLLLPTRLLGVSVLLRVELSREQTL